MDVQAFSAHLRRTGKSQSAIDRSLRLTERFAKWLGTTPEEASREQLLEYVAELDRTGSAKPALWALAAYFDFVSASDLAMLARELRSARIKPAPFRLAGFSGLDPHVVAALADVGIRTTDQLLGAAATAEACEGLARKTGVDPAAVVNLLELARLAAIRGVKGTRARLYRGAVGTIDGIAALEPAALIAVTTEYISKTGFDGIPPTPKEAAFTVAEARRITTT
ncbi:MAG: DUF4332 domain-containing protein [Acidimicrobiia bacterium]|nr:DUF4332 domain-containing protein [Acidimicrobiia bacterium]